MATVAELLKKRDWNVIWDKYCGFAKLDWEEFRYVQDRLLEEQIELLSGCSLGKRIFGGRPPRTVEEFRRFTPMTTYEDYSDYLLEKREDVLSDKPKFWVCTSWKGTKDPVKWAPYSETMIRENAKAFMAAVIFATTNEGKINLREGDKFFYGMAPLPYLTGLAPYGIMQEIALEYLPDLEKAEKMDFMERNKEGFKLGLEKGIDIFFGLSSVLVKIAESFSQNLKGEHDSSSGSRSGVGMKTALRVGKGLAKSKIAGRELLPKDVWDIKGIICAGTDTSLFKDKIEHYWGRRPLEIYGGTELSIVATEVAGSEGLLFFPDVNYLEFIPEEESRKSQHRPEYVPETLLLNELEVGKRYEIVTTKLKGGTFVRYRVGDLIRVVAPARPEMGILMPQIRYEDRISNVIDLAGFTRLTEVTISDAIMRTGVGVNNWVARKELGAEGPYLHLYLEPLRSMDKTAVEKAVHARLSEIDQDFRDYEQMLGRRPMKLSLLAPGTFKEYARAAGSSIFSRMNPDAQFVEGLLRAEETVAAAQREVG